MSYALPSALHYRRLACSSLVRSGPCSPSSPGASHRWLQVLVPTAFLDRARIEFSEAEVAISVLRRVRDFSGEAVRQAIEDVFAEFGNKQFACDYGAISDVFQATMNSISTDGQLGQPMFVRQATDCAALRAQAAFAYEMQRSVVSNQTMAYDRYGSDLDAKSGATLRRSLGLPAAGSQISDAAAQPAGKGAEEHQDCVDGAGSACAYEAAQEFAIADPAPRRQPQAAAGEANVLPTVAKAKSDLNFVRNAQKADQVAEEQRASEFNTELCPFAPQITEKAREMTYPEAMQRIEDRVKSHIDYRLDLQQKIAKKVTDERLKECTFAPTINPAQPQYADIYTRWQITSLVNDGNWRATDKHQSPNTQKTPNTQTSAPGRAAEQQDAKSTKSAAAQSDKAFRPDLAETLAGTALAAE